MAWIAVDTDQNPGFTDTEKQNNVAIIADFFRLLGWTDNAISALCGNFDIESYINPGQFELYQNYSPYYGFGLVQWTPYTNYSSWAGADWRTNYTKQLERIKYELDNGLQWIPVSAYNYMTFQEFTESTDTPEYLVMAFEYSYERGTPFTSAREAAARKWYEYIITLPPPGQLPPWLIGVITRRKRKKKEFYAKRR